MSTTDSIADLVAAGKLPSRDDVKYSSLSALLSMGRTVFYSGLMVELNDGTLLRSVTLADLRQNLASERLIVAVRPAALVSADSQLLLTDRQARVHVEAIDESGDAVTYTMDNPHERLSVGLEAVTNSTWPAEDAKSGPETVWLVEVGTVTR